MRCRLGSGAIAARNSRSRGYRRSARGHLQRRGAFAAALGAFERLEDRELLAGDSGGALAPAAIQSDYGQLPLSFEVNQGQTNSQVDYLARGAGYTLYLTGSGAVLDLQQSATQPNSNSGATGQVSGTVIDMQFVGADSAATVTGLDKQQTVSNYFVGSDPSQWHAGVANFGQVEYQNLYSGISAVFHGNQELLEYDFNIAPGADPNQIQWQIAGSSGVSLDSAGNLLIHTAGGDLVEKAPNIYQEVGGQRVAVSGHFVLEGGNRVGFAIGSYDASAPLVIDPLLSYSSYIGASTGASDSDWIAADSSGSAYVTGRTNATNFPTTPGAFQTSLAGSSDVYVAKFSADGKSLVYSTYLGGTNLEFPGAIAVDASGNAYVVGVTQSNNFPVTAGALQTVYGGGARTAFVTKLNPTGTALGYSTYLGGNNFDNGNSIAVDGAGDAYVTGATSSSNFPTTAGAFQTTLVGSSNAFVAKLNPAGSALIYSTFLGGSGGDSGFGIAIDGAGNAYVAGRTSSSNFPTTAGAFQTAFGTGPDDAFVTKLNPMGTALVYSTFIGTDDEAFAIAIDSSGNAYITGTVSSASLPTTAGAFQTTFGGGYDTIVVKLNAAGSALVYSTYLGGSGLESGESIALDGAGDAFVAGFTNSTNFPVTPGAFQPTYGGGSSDVFLTKLNALGSSLIYSTYQGGSATDSGRGLAVDSAGNAYVTGDTASPNFPVTAGAFQTTFNGSGDGFVSKFLFAATHNQLFINQLYHDLLGREVDAGGLTYWDAQLAAGLPRSVMALELEQSLEYAQRTVASLYNRYLHRAGDAGGVNYFAQLMLQGVTVEQIAAVLIGSDEFFTVQGGGTNNGFLNALYQDALGRPIDSGGLAWWNSVLAAGVPRSQVAALVLATVEYRQGVVQAAYQQLLGRAADSGGLTYWTNALNAGATDQQLNAALAGSDEYYARTA